MCQEPEPTSPLPRFLNSHAPKRVTSLPGVLVVLPSPVLLLRLAPRSCWVQSQGFPSLPSGAKTAPLVATLTTCSVPVFLLATLSLISAALLDSIRALSHGQWLLGLRGLLESSVNALGCWSSRRGSILGQRVLDLHDPVIELSSVELLDGGGCRHGLNVDEGGGAQVLAMHVLVKARRDERSTLGEKFLQTKDFGYFQITLSLLEGRRPSLCWRRCCALLASSAQVYLGAPQLELAAYAAAYCWECTSQLAASSAGCPSVAAHRDKSQNVW